MNLKKQVSNLAVSAAVARRGIEYAATIPYQLSEIRADKNPDSRRVAGRALLGLLVEKSSYEGSIIAFHTPDDEVKKEPGRCPVMMAKNGFEYNLLTATIRPTLVGPQAELHLYQAHIKSWQEVLISQKFQIAPDGVTQHTRTPHRLKHHDQGRPDDHKPALSGLKDIRLLSNLVDAGVMVEDPSVIQENIEQFHDKAAKYSAIGAVVARPNLRIVS